MNKNILYFVGAVVGLGFLARSAKAAPEEGKIVATDLTVDKLNCQGACTVNGSAKWRNDGNTQRSFTPAVSMNGVTRVISDIRTLQPGEETTAIPFSTEISELTAFCPVPGFQ